MDTVRSGREGRVLIVSPRNLRRLLASLPALVREWEELGFDGRYDFTMAWDNQMCDLSDSGGQYVQGELPQDESEEYLALLAETLGVLPLAERIGLHGPDLPPGHPRVAPTQVSNPQTGEELRMSREDDRSTVLRTDEREPPTEQRPIWPTRGQLDRWREMTPQERFKDADYQRWAQSFRSRESLSAAGREGYDATVRKYGKDFLYDRAADKRREREVPYSGVERRMMRMLEEIGEKQDRSEYGGSSGTYHREHKLASLRHADFAWPEKNKAIETWGGVHTSEFFVRQDKLQEANRRQVERAQAAGWQLMIVTADELRRDNWDETRERVRRFLA